MTNPTPDKLAEAKKLLENIDKDLGLLLKGNYSCARVWEAWQYGTMKEEDFAPLEEDENIINDFQNFISKLLSAQDLISYERGREEQRKEDSYIGLTDKNGQKIYEGDILQDEKGKGKVVWLDSRGGWAVHSLDEEGYFYPHSYGEYQLKNTVILNPSPDAK